MSLITRKSPFDMEWPAWMAGRSILDLPESWVETMGEAAIRVEEFEENNQLVVRAEVPGVNPDEDVEITVTEGTLRIMVQRKKETKSESKRHYRSEFQYGSFVRTIALPAGATDKDVKADYKDGVLEVRVPINGQHAEAKKIPIQKR